MTMYYIVRINDDGTEEVLHKTPDVDRAIDYRNMYPNAYVMTRHERKRH